MIDKFPSYDYKKDSLSEIKETYNDVGFLKLNNFFDKKLIYSFLKEFKSFCIYVLEEVNEEFKDINQLSTEEIINLVFKHLPSKASHLQHIGRELSSFKRLISSESLEDISKQILDTDITQTIFDTSILRIDRKSENPILDWHQDFPTNMSSLNAITFWIPLNKITPQQGQVRFVPNSNKKIIPIEYSNREKSKHYSTKYTRMQNQENIIKQFEKDSLLLKSNIEIGDIILFHAQTVHRSSLNLTDKARIVSVVRYGDHKEKSLASRNWFTCRSKYPDLFNKIYPDLTKVVD